ncbi:MAG: hypothetical protein ABIR96_09165 [Bdellovibrionota bacterium]
MKSRIFGVLCLFSVLVAGEGRAQLPTKTTAAPRVQEKLTEMPVDKQGLTMNQASSCIIINQLPWVFRKTKRQSRLLIRDKIRFATQSEFVVWEIHQVMDQNGYISYVFKRPLPTGGTESIVTKENYYNKIRDVSGVKKITDVRNLTNFVDRNALTFYTEGKGRIVYQPGLSGQSRLFLSYDAGDPPVLLKGSDCRRGCVDGRDPFESSCGNMSFDDDAKLEDQKADKTDAGAGGAK